LPFAELLKDARGKRGWSKARLAKVAGVDRAIVSRIENGIHPGSLRTVARLARALGIDLNELKHDDTDAPTLLFADDPTPEVA
jgi:transcriptional regulator with XRE-family HTH domain